MSQKIIYGLKCGHATLGVPTLVTGVLWCPWCLENCPIAEVVTYEWRAKCLDCTYARWAGTYKRSAEVMSNGHSRKNPGHNVSPEYVLNPMAVRTAEKMAEWNAIH